MSFALASSFFALDHDRIIVAAVAEGVGALLAMSVCIRRRLTFKRRLCWAVVILIPIIGPVVYLLSRPLPSNEGDERDEFDNYDGTNHDPGDFGGHGG